MLEPPTNLTSSTMTNLTALSIRTSPNNLNNKIKVHSNLYLSLLL